MKLYCKCQKTEFASRNISGSIQSFETGSDELSKQASVFYYNMYKSDVQVLGKNIILLKLSIK